MHGPCIRIAFTRVKNARRNYFIAVNKEVTDFVIWFEGLARRVQLQGGIRGAGLQLPGRSITREKMNRETDSLIPNTLQTYKEKSKWTY
jgi:hypothetical protein